jgi:hypothetical protein
MSAARGEATTGTGGRGIRLAAALLSTALAACSTPAAPLEPPSPAPSAVAASPSPPRAAPSARVPPSPAASPGPLASASSSAAPSPPPISAADAERVLFPQASPGFTTGECPRAEGAGADDRRIRCMIGLRYRGDDAAKALAIELHERSGGIAGVERERVMDGGFRGKIRLVPEPPVGQHRKHLAWVAGAAADFDDFFRGLSARAKRPIVYRHRPIAWKFLRSVGRTTPSAYAGDWSIGYNVSGSLHASADAVRETLFHEIFHLNDEEALDWSRRVLGSLYDGLVARCGTKVPCLTPYAPNRTMVRGGTYYAFQPDNGDGVHEYAAELALRYYREQRARLRGEPEVRPAFKCGPEENARAWSLMVDQLFGGADLVPACTP